jgi:hypothetical protein
MRRIVAKLDKHPWVFSLVLIVVVSLPGFVLINAASAKTDRVVACVQEWAETDSNRTKAISEAGQNRQDALDLLVRSVGLAQVDRTVWDRAYSDYIRASDTYKKVVREHPVPAPPTEICG